MGRKGCWARGSGGCSGRRAASGSRMFCFGWPLFSGDAEIFDVEEHVGGIGIDAECAGPPEFLFAVTPGEEADGEGATASGGDHVPNGVPDYDAVFQGGLQFFSG